MNSIFASGGQDPFCKKALTEGEGPGLPKTFFKPGFYWGVLLFVILMVVYSVTLLPGTGNNCDTAKFQFVGKVLGTPHPPGFPTYLFLNHLFLSLFPFGTLAYKANLLSALFSAISSLFFFFLLKHCFKLKNSSAFITALTFGLTYTLWSQSIVAEVNSLNILFLTMVTFYFFRWNETGKERYFYIACAVYALSFGNHPLVLAFLPGLVFLVWRTDKKAFLDIKKILWVLVFIVLSALQYAYFFWRYYDPNTPYIEMATPNLERFFWYVTGAQYKSGMFAYSIPQMILKQLPLFFKFVLNEFFFLIPIAIWGVIKLKNKTIHIFFLLVFIVNMILSMSYSAAEIFTYLVPNYFIIAVYAGIGLNAVLKALHSKQIAWVRYLLPVIPVFFLLFNFPKMERFNSPHHAHKVEYILRKVNKNALVVSPDDYYSQYFWYYLIGEGVEARKGIFLMHHVDICQVKQYLIDNKPIYLPEQRKYAPPGLSVYCINPEHVNAFKGANLHILKLNDFLYKVSR